MKCPICSKPSVPAYRPFCSKRCADIDLAKWLNEDYSAPAVDDDGLEEALFETSGRSEKKTAHCINFLKYPLDTMATLT